MDTYYTEGKTPEWFESSTNKELVDRLRKVVRDLIDSDIGTLESWMPIVAIVDIAADRIEKLDNVL